MTTEYGRGICGYGDFGRYTFQSALSSWDVNVDELSNIAVEWIFTKYGYDAELHGKFDRSIGSGRGRESADERIGKKYQWIALHEMLARVSDNCVMKSESSWQEDADEPYEGTWQPYVRDIDPSMPLRNTKELDENYQTEHWWLKEKHNNWRENNSEWLNNSEDLPDTVNLITLHAYADNSGLNYTVHINTLCR